jgi:hypothetical protein
LVRNTLVPVPLASFNYTSIDYPDLDFVKESNGTGKLEAKLAKSARLCALAMPMHATICHSIC